MRWPGRARARRCSSAMGNSLGELARTVVPLHCLVDLCSFAELQNLGMNQHVTFRARIHTIPPISASLAFIIFRLDETSIQCVLHDNIASLHMIQVASETVFRIIGSRWRNQIQPLEPVQSTSIQHCEIKIESLHLIHQAEDIPFSVYGEHSEPVHKQLDNRIMDLRHSSNHAIFKIRARFLQEFRKRLKS